MDIIFSNQELDKVITVYIKSLFKFKKLQKRLNQECVNSFANKNINNYIIKLNSQLQSVMEVMQNCYNYFDAYYLTKQEKAS